MPLVQEPETYFPKDSTASSVKIYSHYGVNFPSSIARMHWGLEHSVGPYLNYWSAVLGLSLFPIGYLLHSLTK